MILMHKMKTIAVVAAFAFAGPAACGGAPAPQQPTIGVPGPLTSITLSADVETTSVAVGDTLPLVAIAQIGSGVVNKTTSVHYEASDTSIAEVVSAGVIKGLRAGAVAVTAEYEGVRSKPLRIEVVRP